jgi:formylmethanofuran dehydrogenase subunit E
MMTRTLPELLAASAALHKHLCPRQVLGVRMGLFAGELLGVDVPQSDKRLLTIVETDGCAADGIAVAVNCWVGRRTMRVEDFGKVAATFVDTLTERAVRIAPGPAARTLAGECAYEARSRWEAMLLGYQRLPAEKLFVFESVSLNVPLADLISRPGLKAVCEACGEEILNGREICHEGMILCRACAGRAYYHAPASLEPAASAVSAALEKN